MFSITVFHLLITWKTDAFTLLCFENVQLYERNDCICSDSYGNEFEICYRSKENASRIGRKFSCEHLGLRFELAGFFSDDTPTDKMKGFRQVFDARYPTYGNCDASAYKPLILNRLSALLSIQIRKSLFTIKKFSVFSLWENL
ncbi:unnamed protein product [Haemonchus placei]|uniref:CUB domain-containing protein n=1 Tax=Haemonchus placei TaxID=6290 RepID=A0A0N4W889_HAEPC|nr:unnamed protein product [Haemonchus placei]